MCKCGGKGHNEAVCPSKPEETRQCHNCGGIGHLSRKCPTPPQKKRSRHLNDIVVVDDDDEEDGTPQAKRSKSEKDESGPAKGTKEYHELQVAAEKKKLTNMIERRRNLEAELRTLKTDTGDTVKNIKATRKGN